MRAARRLSLLFGFWLGACAGSPAALRPAREEDRCGATVVEALPAGAEDVVVADLARMRAEPALAGLLAVVRPDDPDAFVRTFAFRPEAVRTLAYARYEPGELVIVEGDFDAGAVVLHVAERMNTIEIVDSDPPRRVGFVGAARIDVAAIGPHRLALGRENGAPMMRLLARCAGRPAPRFVERAGADVRAALERAPLALAFDMDERPGFDTQAGVVLAELRWSVLGIGGEGDRLRLALELFGPLPETADANLRGIVDAVASSEIGGVFGIRDAIGTLEVGIDAEHARISMELQGIRVAEGLALVLGEPISLP